jgi:hypothetical protein
MNGVKSIQRTHKRQSIGLVKRVGIPRLWLNINPDNLKAGVGVTLGCAALTTEQIQESRH